MCEGDGSTCTTIDGLIDRWVGQLVQAGDMGLWWKGVTLACSCVLSIRVLDLLSKVFSTTGHYGNDPLPCVDDYGSRVHASKQLLIELRHR